MEQIVFLNGALVPRSRAKISPFDLGFLYGYGLFETMRSYSGRIFSLEMHLERIARSARLLGIPLNTRDLEKACYDTLTANKLRDARIRLIVSIGEGEAVPEPPKHPKPTVLVIASNYIPPSEEVYRKGYKAVVVSTRQNSQSSLSNLKTVSWLNNILARKEVKTKGADEAILLNERGFLCEGSTCNIFLVSRGKLITPSVASGCLPGITREIVIGLARELGIEFAERKVRLAELLRADEAFLSSSVIELMPLTEVDGKPIGSGKRGKITEKLSKAFRELVIRETK